VRLRRRQAPQGAALPKTRAALAVSRELLELYWTTGRDLEQIATACGNFAVEPHHGIAFENQGLQSQLHFVAQPARQITAWTEEKR